MGVLAIAAGTAVSLLRQPGAGALNTIWAEDGQIFLGQAVQKGFLHSLTTSYAGYFHLVPRLLTGVATLFPANAAAAVLAVEAAMCTATIAVLVYVASSGHLASRLSRLIMAAFVVLLPLGTGDLLNSVANFHWPGLFALFWMLVWTPRGRAGRIVAPLVILLVAGSDILTLVYLPLALVRVWNRRDRYSAGLLAVLSLGLAVQVVGLATGSSTRSTSPNPIEAVRGLLVRGLPSALLGENWLGSKVDTHWLILAGVAWLLLVIVVGLGLLRLTRPHWALAIVALLHAGALYALPVTLQGVATPRYAAAPAMLIVTAIVAVLQPSGSTLAERGPILAFGVLMAVVCAVNLRVDNQRAHGPTWSDALRQARSDCADRPLQDVVVQIPPVENPPWQITLRCQYVNS